MNSEEKKECCCHGENKEIKEEKPSCCHSESKEVKEEKPSCCHRESKEAKEEKSSCCHGEAGAVKKPAYENCCGTTPKKVENQNCCGKTQSKKGQSVFSKYSVWIILGVSLASLIVSYVMAEKIHGTIFQYFDAGYIAVILCGTSIFISAFKNLFKGKITSALLISISIIACIVLEILMLTKVLPGGEHGHGNIFAAGEVAFLMKLGGVIEDITVGKARSGVERLMSLAPVTAKYRVGDTIIEKPVKDVKIGDIVVVLPNDIISVDGYILSGETAVDESVMTGESMPADKKKGDSVYGGTLNKSGAVEICVTKTSDQMAVNKLRELVEEAEGKKAPISRLADKWASFIVPGAIILSIAVFFLTYFAFTKSDMSEAVLRGVTMLVVFCPCALALATPTAVAAGLGAGARHGVLIKSGAALEELAKVNTIAFDKTGTLTQGSIAVDDIICYSGDKERLMAFAGACEALSEHPLAKAIVLYCSKHVSLPLSKDTKSLVGSGVECTVEGNKILCCKWDYLDGINVDTEDAKADAERFFSQGKTVVAVVINDGLAGLFILSDEIKNGAAECVAELNSSGYETLMLTGDNRFAAADIAKKAGITNYSASLLPEGKLAKIEQIKQSGKKVCMVGDGVNDAPCLAASNCSIAMGALGSDIAIETADIALMNNDIKNVARVTKFSKKTLNTIKLNIIMSMTINVLALVLNLLGLLNPVTGALIHNCSSVLVVINSAFLLKRWGKNSRPDANRRGADLGGL